MPSHAICWQALIIVLGFVLSYAPNAIAFPFYGRYLPFDRAQLGQPFPQSNFSHYSYDDPPNTFQENGVTFTHDRDGLLDLKGRTKLGKYWKLSLAITAAGTETIEADLDGNGEKDLIVVMFTAACGIAPNAQLALVMFDKHRTPRVYDIRGDFFVDKDGSLEDLRKLPGRRGAVLIQQTLAGYWDVNGGKNFWRTTMWQAKSCNWIGLTHFGTPSVSLPTYTLFARKPRHKHVTVRHKLEVPENDADIRPLLKGWNEIHFIYYQPVK
jgi:hypothetical protein